MRSNVALEHSGCISSVLDRFRSKRSSSSCEAIGRAPDANSTEHRALTRVRSVERSIHSSAAENYRVNERRVGPSRGFAFGRRRALRTHSSHIVGARRATDAPRERRRCDFV